MGLDAVVYKNRTKLPVDPEHAGLQLDQSTGEWYSQASNLPEPIRSEGVEALHKQLGNVSLVAALATEVKQLLPTNSVLLTSVLWSGNHAGDVIPLERFSVLKQEITKLRNKSPSRELARFLNSLEELIEVAQDNHNPIAFV